jgi:hypothetical protein
VLKMLNLNSNSLQITHHNQTKKLTT